MEKDLDDKLTKAFPLLYRDRYGSMQTTCLCWGFPEKGWFDLIWDLSSKLEPLIQKWIDENKPTDCAQCGCDEKLHDEVWEDGSVSKKGGICYNIHQLPYHFAWKWKPLGWPSKANNWNDRWTIFKSKYVRHYFVERMKRYVSRTINFVLDILHQQFGLTKRIPCPCKKYLLNHPCASQVKEKYGILHFYTTSASDEMYKLIGEAEKKSEKTCEDCGAIGELRSDYGWYTTLCELHAVREGKRIPTAEEVNEITDEEYEKL